MNIVLYIAIYCIISITLSSLIFYKLLRQCLYKKPGMPPPKKVRRQTIPAMFLLHIFTAIIAIAILPYIEPNNEIALLIGENLSVILYVLYASWYFVKHRLYAGIDFILILLPMAFFSMPIHFLKLSTDIHYVAWHDALLVVYHTFIFGSALLLCIMFNIYHYIPSTRKTIMQLWDGGDSNDK